MMPIFQEKCGRPGRGGLKIRTQADKGVKSGQKFPDVASFIMTPETMIKDDRNFLPIFYRMCPNF